MSIVQLLIIRMYIENQTESLRLVRFNDIHSCVSMCVRGCRYLYMFVMVIKSTRFCLWVLILSYSVTFLIWCHKVVWKNMSHYLFVHCYFYFSRKVWTLEMITPKYRLLLLLYWTIESSNMLRKEVVFSNQYDSIFTICYLISKQ